MVAACGGKSNPTSDDTTGDDQQAADAPPFEGEKQFTLNFPDIQVQPGPGGENTQCVWMKLDNDQEIRVHQIHDVLSTSSHHLIVYRDDMDTTEQTTPVDCQPFTGALNASGMIEPIIITQTKDDMLTLPDGVAYTLAPHQMIKIEMHYINIKDTPQTANAVVNFFDADPATITDEAAVLFTGSPDIDIKKMSDPTTHGAFTLHEFFTVPDYLDLSTSHVFAITGHEHQMGTGVLVNVADSPTGTMTPVYNPTSFLWSEPPTQRQDPGFAVKKGGGFDFTCTYQNTSDQNIGFGESATDEMCFFWAYYYPSQGSKVCVHTSNPQAGGNLNACCPGDGLCSLIQSQF